MLSTFVVTAILVEYSQRINIPVRVSTIARAKIIKLYEFLKLFLRFRMIVHTKLFPSRERKAIIPNMTFNVTCESWTPLLSCVGATAVLLMAFEGWDIMSADLMLKQ